MRLDYADWLTYDRVQAEELLWARDQVYRRYARAIDYLMRYHEVHRVEEYGCGTGWVPTAIDDPLVQYVGYDRNPDCLNLARWKNANRPHVRFDLAEIRIQRPQYNDCVCAFAVLKHFSLDEHLQIFDGMFRSARCAAFTIPIAPSPVEDGIHFTHVRWSEQMLQEALIYVGLREIARDITDHEEPLIIAVR